MPTQEERLSTVERTITLLRDAVGDLSHNETMLLGMTMKQGEIIREIRASLAAFEQSVNQRFETLEGRFDHLEGRFDRLEQLIIDRLPPSQS